MITKSLYRPALEAIKGVIVQARLMALTGCPHSEIASLLDSAEYLPTLLLDEDDKTNEFIANLASIADDFPECRFAYNLLSSPEDGSAD